MIKYIEFCAGGGGMRAGLDAAGWKCVLALDNDIDAIAVHRLAHGDAQMIDVTKLTNSDLPNADVWVAGFPCQPFSSSGSRVGFAHQSGNVFEHIARLMAVRLPPIVVLENVEGLLTNKSGHTFAVILSKLTKMGYKVSWILLDLQWFNVPQSRARLFLVASLPNVIKTTIFSTDSNILPGIGTSQANVFSDFIKKTDFSWQERGYGNICKSEELLRPAIGKAKPDMRSLFGSMGSAECNEFYSYDISHNKISFEDVTLGAIVAPSYRYNASIRSIRFWTTDAGRGPTKLCQRPEPVSHCIGTSLGGAPLFATPLNLVKKKTERTAFLEFSNWHREQDGLLVMRLRPNRAVLLFGPHTEDLAAAVTASAGGDTRKYKVVGNMVAPICAKSVAEVINKNLGNSL